MRQMLLLGFIALLATPANQLMWSTPWHTRYRLILNISHSFIQMNWFEKIQITISNTKAILKASLKQWDSQHKWHTWLLNKVNMPFPLPENLCLESIMSQQILFSKLNHQLLHRAAEEWWLSTQLQAENNLVNHEFEAIVGRRAQMTFPWWTRHWGKEAALTMEGTAQGPFKCVKATGDGQMTVKHLKKCLAWQIITQIGRMCLGAWCCPRENEGKQEDFMDQFNSLFPTWNITTTVVFCVKFGSVFICHTEGWEQVDKGDKNSLNMEQGEFRLHLESCTS